jgi:hypothetical protein
LLPGVERQKIVFLNENYEKPTPREGKKENDFTGAGSVLHVLSLHHTRSVPELQALIYSSTFRRHCISSKGTRTPEERNATNPGTAEFPPLGKQIVLVLLLTFFPRRHGQSLRPCTQGGETTLAAI